MLLKLMMGQKNQLELQIQKQQVDHQIQLSQIQKGCESKSSSEQELELSSDLSNLDDIILSAKQGLMSGSTTNAWRKRIKWYEEKFGESIKSKDANAVLTTLFHYILDPNNDDKASTKRNILVNFYAILSAVVGKGGQISLQMNKRRIEIHRILKKIEEKERG